MYEPKLYDNIFNFKNAGPRIYNMDDLHEGQKYVLDIPGSNNEPQYECGPLIKKTHTKNVKLPYEIGYCGIWFRIGTAKYNGTKMEDQVHQYHWQDHIKLSDMRVKIYEYYLDGDLQTQIRLLPYYKKTVKNICSELNICEDIERLISRYF